MATKHRKPRPYKFGIYSSTSYTVDQGVDFSGKGLIPALGNGVVTDVGRVHILEGGSWPYVIYKLTSGAHAGQFVYVMENFIPKVVKGARLRAGQAIGVAVGKYPYTETGFNRTGAGINPVAPLNPNPHSPKAAGYAMLRYIQAVEGHKTPVTIAKQPSKAKIQKILNEYLAGKITKAQAEKILGGPITDNTFGSLGNLAHDLNPATWINKLIFALAIGGGGMVTILGLLLTAADVGLSTRAGRVAAAIPAGRLVTRAARPVTSRADRKATTASRESSERRKEEVHRAKVKTEQAKATELRTRTRHRSKASDDKLRKAYRGGAMGRGEEESIGKKVRFK